MGQEEVFQLTQFLIKKLLVLELSNLFSFMSLVESNSGKFEIKNVLEEGDTDGWISPSGIFYKCTPQQHDACVEEIVRLQDLTKAVINSGYEYTSRMIAMRNGYVELSGGTIQKRLKGLSVEQLDLIKDTHVNCFYETDASKIVLADFIEIFSRLDVEDCSDEIKDSMRKFILGTVGDFPLQASIKVFSEWRIEAIRDSNSWQAEYVNQYNINRNMFNNILQFFNIAEKNIKVSVDRIFDVRKVAKIMEVRGEGIYLVEYTHVHGGEVAAGTEHSIYLRTAFDLRKIGVVL